MRPNHQEPPAPSKATSNRWGLEVTNYGESAKTGTKSGSKLFAGPRDDPFFFDREAYTEVLAGNAPGFSDPGTDLCRLIDRDGNKLKFWP
ncbi:MAG: hypothetical protein AAGI38_24755 [Bacteroidota bacterium]